MVEFFPIASRVTDLNAVSPGTIIEARKGDIFVCREKIDLVDAGRGIVWVRGGSGHLTPLSAQHFTFWRYVL